VTMLMEIYAREPNDNGRCQDNSGSGVGGSTGEGTGTLMLVEVAVEPTPTHLQTSNSRERLTPTTRSLTYFAREMCEGRDTLERRNEQGGL